MLATCSRPRAANSPCVRRPKCTISGSPPYGEPRRSNDEFDHHLNIGRVVGLSDDDIAAAESGSTERLAERTEALDTRTVNQLADLTVTVGFSQLVGNFLNTFGPTPEGEAI